MKRTIKSQMIEKYVDILVTIDDFVDTNNIAARTSVNIKHPSIRKELKMSDDALHLYKLFLDCAVEVIETKRLKIAKQTSSSKSYAYYIDVEHVDYVDNVRIKYVIHFRISDHINKTIENQTSKRNSDEIQVPVIKQIQIGSYRFTTYVNAIVYLNEICIGILNNDLNCLESARRLFD